MLNYLIEHRRDLLMSEPVESDVTPSVVRRTSCGGFERRRRRCERVAVVRLLPQHLHEERAESPGIASGDSLERCGYGLMGEEPVVNGQERDRLPLLRGNVPLAK